jgi:hypothetical protein
MEKGKDMKVKPGDQSKAPKTGKWKRPQGEDFMSPKELEGKQSMAPQHKGKEPSHGDHPSTPPKSKEMKEPDKKKLA